MKECRVSVHNQVIEVFEKGKYNGEQFNFIRHEIHECLDSTKPLMWYYNNSFHEHQNITKLKSEKLSQLSISATNAMQSFTFDNLTFEMSGQVETRLDRLERKIIADNTYVEMWLVLDGTYTLGERDFIYINKDNIIQFANAYESKVRSVLSWKKGAEYWLNIATTIEEVNAISTEYIG